ncbi:DUF2095 domain-containing protein [Candidatus Bathyarchaeota archaeon]|nr:MAG: DUF2095 domain-containing protein [Candidatus Bathyarchaeota archaeon]
MEIDKKQFKKMFPNLAREMSDEDNRVTITSVRSDIESGEKIVSKSFRGYNPDVIDFLRRCDNEEQANEIIDYLEERKEISEKYASHLRRQLKEKGIRSFGSKKEDGYYLKQAGY